MLVMAPPVQVEAFVRLSTHAQRRVAPSTPVGQTIYHDVTGWHIGRTPSSDVLDAADIVLLGGHVYDLALELVTEIEAALNITLLVQ
jgi:hypothetical protein